MADMSRLELGADASGRASAPVRGAGRRRELVVAVVGDDESWDEESDRREREYWRATHSGEDRRTSAQRQSDHLARTVGCFGSLLLLAAPWLLAAVQGWVQEILHRPGEGGSGSVFHASRVRR